MTSSAPRASQMGQRRAVPGLQAGKSIFNRYTILQRSFKETSRKYVPTNTLSHPLFQLNTSSPPPSPQDR
jgi:hypothetical protein